MFYVRRHESAGDVVVACCDKELLGTTLTEGELEIRVNERFYGGELMEAAEAVNAIRAASIANLMGDRIVGHAIKSGLVEEENTRTVGGVRHTQIITIPEQ